jgi:hypothetical protein
MEGLRLGLQYVNLGSSDASLPPAHSGEQAFAFSLLSRSRSFVNQSTSDVQGDYPVFAVSSLSPSPEICNWRIGLPSRRLRISLRAAPPKKHPCFVLSFLDIHSIASHWTFLVHCISFPVQNLSQPTFPVLLHCYTRYLHDTWSRHSIGSLAVSTKISFIYSDLSFTFIQLQSGQLMQFLHDIHIYLPRIFISYVLQKLSSSDKSHNFFSPCSHQCND